MRAPEVAGVAADGTPEDLEERGNSAADIAAAITQGVDNSAELDTSHLKLQTGPVSTELLEKIDELYAELKLEEVRDLLDELRTMFATMLSEETTDAETHRRIAEAIAKGEVDDAEFYARDLMSRGEERVSRVAELIEPKGAE